MQTNACTTHHPAENGNSLQWIGELTYLHSEEAGQYKGANQKRDNQSQRYQGIEVLSQAVLEPLICISAGAPDMCPGATHLLGWQRPCMFCLLLCACMHFQRLRALSIQASVAAAMQAQSVQKEQDTW